MDLQIRLELVVKLGNYMLSNQQDWQNCKEKAERENAWFTSIFIEKAVENIVKSFLQQHLLLEWVSKYDIQQQEQATKLKNVGIVMAGNIPIVGFHDFLCVFISGHKQTIKASSRDSILIKHLIGKLIEWEKGVSDVVVFEENLKGCDAYIATGSNNSSRYFEYYFGKYPNIIRKNRTSVALLDGYETIEELALLADDIQMYFGLGCRNVTKLYVPLAYNFESLLAALKKYSFYFEFHKYKHNFDYQLAIQMMSRKFYMTEGSILLTENASIFSPVSQVNYEFYDSLEEIKTSLLENDSIQCIVGKRNVPFGEAQKPSLMDYADGIDTMIFLKGL